jgi:hypothetical protein
MHGEEYSMSGAWVPDSGIDGLRPIPWDKWRHICLWNSGLMYDRLMGDGGRIW